MDVSISSGVLHPLVIHELNAIKHLPLTEERAEGPHGVMSRQHKHAPASLYAWKAATARMKDSLGFLELLSRDHVRELYRNWSCCRRVLQVEPTLQERPVRNTLKAFTDGLYLPITREIMLACPISSANGGIDACC